MAYNKAKAEKEWLRWKEVEEKKLRELGVDEETIQRLHTYDWAQFNDILSWIEKNGLGSPTGRNEQSGFVVYPEYRFHPERLKELDDKGYAEYENLLKQQQQHMKKGWDR